ncbi:unnamed protein product [marine sediment metagenome]|uniref:Desulfoferrodoxin ferrous iron-binding domain-containing protein n=1 Tax=marine sediment metagenome TaxID=412755 RepID=X1E2V6_9ZZZZ
MKKNIIFLFLLIMYLFLPTQAFSHPASKVILSVEGNILHVTVQHNVGNPQTHYINEIIVILNGKKIITQLFFLQTDNTQKVSYTIPSLKSGDTITVEASCNRGGIRKGTITVKPTAP